MALLPPELEVYRNATVEKNFPGFGTFKGFVDKIEKDSDDDAKIFFVKYPQDGDREWVDLAELQKIVVKDGDDIVYYKKQGASKASSASKKAQKPAPQLAAKRKKGGGAGAGSVSKRARTARSPAAVDGAALSPQADAAPVVEAPAGPSSPPARAEEPAAEAASACAAPPEEPSAAAAGAAGASARVVPRGAGRLAARQAATDSSGRTPGKGSKAAAKLAAATSGHGEATSAPTPAAAAAALPLAEGGADAPVEAPPSPAAKEAAETVAALRGSAAPQEDEQGAAPAVTAGEPLTAAGQPAAAGGESPQPANYSQVVERDNWVFVAGQVAGNITSANGRTYQGQITQVFAQIDKLLGGVGASKDDVVTVTVYLRDLKLGAAVLNSVWDTWVNPAKLPTRTVVEAKMLHDDTLVEVSCIAFKQREG